MTTEPTQRALLEHFRKMQDMCSRYLEPTDYMDRNGAKHVDGSSSEQAAFNADIIYMLDGPEQRATEAALASPSEPAQPGASVSDEWIAYMNEAVSNAPEPLRQLGEYLAGILDEDHWKTAERYLNAALLGDRRGGEGHKPAAPADGDVERVEIDPDDPLYKALRPQPETIAAIEKNEQANAEALAAIRNMMVGHCENWPSPKKFGTALMLIDKTLHAAISDMKKGSPAYLAGWRDRGEADEAAVRIALWNALRSKGWGDTAVYLAIEQVIPAIANLPEPKGGR